MRTRRLALAVAGLAVVGLAVALLLRPGAEQSPNADAPASRRAAPVAAEATLYCEFYNFVGRTPKVGFHFALPPAGRVDYAQIFQREIDGTQTDFGADRQPRPAWAFDGSDSPATLRSPDGAIQINLYGYDAAKAGPAWIEAGLRSIQYLNLDGKCRRSGTA